MLLARLSFVAFLVTFGIAFGSGIVTMVEAAETKRTIQLQQSVGE